MRPDILALVIVTSFLGTEGLAADPRWTIYEDADISCVLDYPAGLFRPEALTPDEPRRFSSPDADVYFRIKRGERERLVSAGNRGKVSVSRYARRCDLRQNSVEFFGSVRVSRSKYFLYEGCGITGSQFGVHI